MQRFLKRVKNHFLPSKHNAYRPGILRRSSLLLFLGLIIGAEGLLAANLISRQSGENFLAAVLPGEVIALTNGERAQNKVGSLHENAQLDAAAQAKARDMASRGYFAHTSPDGKAPWEWITAAGYDYQYAGENLAVRFVDSKDVVNAWMASPSHRSNIVKPVYTDIGVGIATGTYQGAPATFVVQYFGKPEASAAVAQAGEVRGAEVGPVSPHALVNSTMQSINRLFAQFAGEPRSTTAWALGGIATLLMVAVLFAFFIHIDVQPTQMLLGGAMIAVFALSLVAINSKILSSTITAENQPAGAALFMSGVVIGEAGAAVER